MDNPKETQSRRGWLQMLAAGAGGVVLGGVGMKCCTVKNGLPQCAVTTQPNTLTVVAHGMMVIGVFPDTGASPAHMRIALPKICCHERLAGAIDDLRSLDEGQHKLVLSKAGNDPPCNIDGTHDILISKQDGLKFRPSCEDPVSNHWVLVDMPLPRCYKTFSVAKRKFKKRKYPVNPPGDFALGHVFQYTCAGATLVSPSGCNLQVPVSSGMLSNFHIYNEDPNGPHMDHHTGDLNNLFSPALDVDINDDPDHPPARPGCDLQSFGISSLDECDLSELPWHAREKVKTNIDPASCLKYFYDETKPR
jgi:hypothetical protein